MTCRIARSDQHFIQTEPVALSGRACGLRDSRASSVFDLHLVLDPARRVFHPRIVCANEASVGRLNRSWQNFRLMREMGGHSGVLRFSKIPSR